MKIIIDQDLQEIVPKFLEVRKNDFKNFITILENNDKNKMKMFVHQVTGVSSGYGFNILATMAKEIETLFLNNNPKEALKVAYKYQQTLNSLEIEYQEVED